MQIELAVVAIIVFYILSKSGRISISKLIADNEMYFRKLKESDYEFYVKAKYGDSVNADILFNKRLQNSLIIMLVVFCLVLKNMSYLYFIVILVVGFAFFK